jgi:hypothetical protein
MAPKLAAAATKLEARGLQLLCQRGVGMLPALDQLLFKDAQFRGELTHLFRRPIHQPKPGIISFLVKREPLDDGRGGDLLACRSRACCPGSFRFRHMILGWRL